MIAFLDIAAFFIQVANGFAFYLVLGTFMPMRGNIAVRVAAIVCCVGISSVVIYSHDTINILGVLLGFLAYMAVFYKGDLAPKLSIVFILYPMLVSLNFFTQDIGKLIYFSLANQTMLISTAIYAITLALRPLAWLAVWRIAKRWTENIIALLNTKMWLLLDSICAAVLASLLVVLNFLPEETQIAYPVAFASMITVIGCMYLIAHIANSVQTGAQLQSLMAEHRYYEDKLKDEERVRAIYHDMKNHLLLLQSAQSEGDVRRMAESLQTQISSYENYHKTGNTFLDVILRDKAEKAKEHGIDFSAMLRFEAGGFIAPLDISAIFGNALDNAIEASGKLPVSERLITARADRVRDMLTISVENRTAENPDATLQTQKQDKLLHGFGLANIKRALEKYDGQCTARHEAGAFTLSIIIPIPQ